MLLTGFSKYKLYPEEKFSDFTPPEKSIPDSPGFYQEWVNACQGGDPATCNFDYSGPLAEAVMLSNLAYRSRSKFNFDSAKLTTDSSSANQYIREEYHPGWEV